MPVGSRTPAIWTYNTLFYQVGLFYVRERAERPLAWFGRRVLTGLPFRNVRRAASASGRGGGFINVKITLRYYWEIEPPSTGSRFQSLAGWESPPGHKSLMPVALDRGPTRDHTGLRTSCTAAVSGSARRGASELQGLGATSRSWGFGAEGWAWRLIDRARPVAFLDALATFGERWCSMDFRGGDSARLGSAPDAGCTHREYCRRHD